jgi:hypothetical protein
MAINEVLVAKTLPTAQSDGRNSYQRGDEYGNTYAVPLGKPANSEAAQGNYFVITNPTQATGVASIAAADGLDDTEAYFYLRNTSATKRVYLDYIKFRFVSGGTNGTNLYYASKVDTGASRFVSAQAGALMTPKNCNMDSDTAFAGSFYAGALVLGAATSDARLLSHGQFRSSIAIAGDNYSVDFGANSGGIQSALLSSSTAQSQFAVRHCPVVLGENDAWCFHLNAASQTVGLTLEFEVAFYQR